MASSKGNDLHIVVFPWLAFGHMLPFLELSKSLACRGHRISFISTPRNIQRLPKPPPHLSPLLHFVPLELLHVKGLPEAAEATSDLASEQVEYLKLAFDHLDEPFRKFIHEASPKPDWIIHDFTHHWLPHIATEAGIPTVYLSIFMAGLIVFFGPGEESGDDGSRKTAEQLAVPPPWVPFPSKLCYRLHEARKLFEATYLSNISGYSDTLRHKISFEGCTAMAIRSNMEVESEWLTLAPQVLGKPVLPVGLLPPQAQEVRSESSNGTTINVVEWLDKQNSRSVVYIAFGSEATLSLELLHELALGLELAGLPFVWTFRRPSNVSDDTALLPKGFEERTRNYGIVSNSWVPQLKILAHEAIGGFLTHTGWSSVIESLQFGLPLVLLPIFGDQGINARVIMKKGMAVEIERDEEDGSFTKEAVAAALRLVVVDEEGERYRSKAKELHKVFADKDRQEKYIDDFVEFLRGK